MLVTLTWPALAIRGVVAILFGLIAFFMPGVTLFALTVLFGAYALIDGIAGLTTAFRSARHGQHWWEFLVEGLFGLGAAVVTLLWPALTLTLLIYIVAAWAIITGIFELLAAVRLRRVITGEWLLVLAGLASIVFGVLLFGSPAAGALVLAWWIGAYVFVFGVLMLGLAFRLRRLSARYLTPQHA